jgi:hypothetical protein
MCHQLCHLGLEELPMSCQVINFCAQILDLINNFLIDDLLLLYELFLATH